MPDFGELLAAFGEEVTAKFRTGAGEPEDHLRSPFERLISGVGAVGGVGRVTLAGEERIGDLRARPDFAVDVDDAVVGFVELKAPGKGAEPSRFRDRHDREQWERLRSLPNLLYSDGESWGLYRDGDRVGPAVRLVGDVQTAGRHLRADGPELQQLLVDFLSWYPVPPRTPRQLALSTARLCALLRAQVGELMASSSALQTLATDWRQLLFPEADDEVFADGYAQTVTFALLLARVEDIDFDDGDLRAIAGRLADRHTLMGTALDVLTDRRLLQELADSLGLLVRVLGVVDWAALTKGDADTWLLFYEEFLQEYDPALRRRTGSYYTPQGAVDPMVRLVDDLVRTRLHRPYGLAAPEVTVVDPAAGTGTFLFRIIDRIATTIQQEEGIAEVPAKLGQAVGRLIGFELQTGPFAVAEFRLAEEYRRRGAPLGPQGQRLYVANTLDDPFVEEHRMGAVYEPIARSRRAANAVKSAEPVMVVIGNPPYRERSKGEGGWIETGELRVDDRTVRTPLDDFLPERELGARAHVKHLYNPYVYFWRWAMWKVFERHPEQSHGIVAFVTVAGFLNGPGFAAMRRHLRRSCDELWVIDLSPEGHQPPVSTRVFGGVQQPVCITIALRDGSTSSDEPAPVHHHAVHGSQQAKFDSLAALTLQDDGWRDCSAGWTASFLPASGASWTALPRLDELLPWSGSGVMPGRTWVRSPSPDVLRQRWRLLVDAPANEQSKLLDEHRQDRTVHTVLSEGIPRHPIPQRSLTDETDDALTPVRIGFRSFDRQWLLPDKRVVNRPNPSLWASHSERQVYLTALMRHSPTHGPAATISALVPDHDHYRGSFAGRAFPLWRDVEASEPNVAPGLLAELAARFGIEVSAEELFAYVVGVLAHPRYTQRFAGDLQQPGLRLPLTGDAALFAEVAACGARVTWLHSYGERFTDTVAGRPSGRPRLRQERRPLVRVAIPSDRAGMPVVISYSPGDQELRVGTGVIAPVPAAVWDYEVSGLHVLRKWFGYRSRDPEGRRSSPLDEIVPEVWDPAWTTELLDLLNVLGLLAELEPVQAELLERVLSGPLIATDDLLVAGVLPVPAAATKPPRAAGPQQRLLE